ncbi:hypothetical protein, partial [Cupriavidus sp. AcVe19-6a]|uniref:hypothetical protein n=1 Tax=Cupriavidus sp. AcVe19-6a TaxID=2821358 RepID=UPI001AE34CB0
LSAAFKNLQEQDDFTTRYEALLEHYVKGRGLIMGCCNLLLAWLLLNPSGLPLAESTKRLATHWYIGSSYRRCTTAKVLHARAISSHSVSSLAKHNQIFKLLAVHAKTTSLRKEPRWSCRREAPFAPGVQRSCR